MKTPLELAQAIIDARLAVIGELGTAGAERDRARAAAEAADKNFTRAYAAALKAGWTDDELGQIGLADGKKPAGRRRRKTPTATAPEAPRSETA